MSRYQIDVGCGKRRMDHTHVFLRFTHRILEKARRDIRDRPGENGRQGHRPKSAGQLLTWKIEVGEAVGRLDNGYLDRFPWTGKPPLGGRKSGEK
jgi:hypothetical protein